MFLRELEEDEEMRGNVNLYRVKNDVPGSGSGLAGGKTRRRGKGTFDMDVDENAEKTEAEAGAEVLGGRPSGRRKGQR